jgi:hypothetical protein
MKGININRAIRIGSRINNSTADRVLVVDDNNRIAETNDLWECINLSGSSEVIIEAKSAGFSISRFGWKSFGAGGGVNGDFSLFDYTSPGRILYVDNSAGTITLGASTAGAANKVIIDNILSVLGGNISNTDRYTSNQTLTAINHKVVGDTDGGAFNITLPAGIDGTNYKITNVGSSGNDLTIIPDGS